MGWHRTILGWLPTLGFGGLDFLSLGFKERKRDAIGKKNMGKENIIGIGENLRVLLNPCRSFT